MTPEPSPCSRPRGGSAGSSGPKNRLKKGSSKNGESVPTLLIARSDATLTMLGATFSATSAIDADAPGPLANAKAGSGRNPPFAGGTKDATPEVPLSGCLVVPLRLAQAAGYESPSAAATSTTYRNDRIGVI